MLWIQEEKNLCCLLEKIFSELSEDNRKKYTRKNLILGVFLLLLGTVLLSFRKILPRLPDSFVRLPEPFLLVPIAFCILLSGTVTFLMIGVNHMILTLSGIKKTARKKRIVSIFVIFSILAAYALFFSAFFYYERFILFL